MSITTAALLPIGISLLVLGAAVAILLWAARGFDGPTANQAGAPTGPTVLSRQGRTYRRAVCADCGRTVAVRTDGQPITNRHRCHLVPPSSAPEVS